MASDDTTFILSVDYELFFGLSGSVERCLFEPCEALISAARIAGIRISFFVDAGMIVCMDRLACKNRRLGKIADQVKRHVTTIGESGHDVELHLHPHWQDTAWRDERWDFSNTRYLLRYFEDDEIEEIFQSYYQCLGDLSERQPSVFRAGGFCIEPFDKIAPGFAKVGINIDSSVVPGASNAGTENGFDFRNAPRDSWWEFSGSPLTAVDGGDYLEVPVTTQRLPATFYWDRLFKRVCGHSETTYFGDGESKAPGKSEVLRRLTGASRIAELSIDAPKAERLLQSTTTDRWLWHVMGHPKLLSPRSLEIMDLFVRQKGIQNFESVASMARRIRNGD